MLIATYVVVEPSNKELLKQILQGIASVSEVTLTVRSQDEEQLERTIGFSVRQSSHDGFDHHFFSGFTYEGSTQLAVNVIIPIGDGEAIVKVGPLPESVAR